MKMADLNLPKVSLNILQVVFEVVFLALLSHGNETFHHTVRMNDVGTISGKSILYVSNFSNSKTERDATK